MPKGTFPDCCCQRLIPVVSACRPSPPQETLHLQVVLVQSPVGSLLLSPESWCMQGLVCVLQDWNLCFPQSCGSSIIKSLWPSRSDSLGFPSPVVRTPGWKPDVGFRTSQPWENFSGIIVFQFVGHPPGRYGICFYRNFVLLTILLWLVLCLCMGAMFFGGFQCPPVAGC